MTFLRHIPAILVVGLVACGGPDGGIPTLVAPLPEATPSPILVDPQPIEAPAPPEGGRGSNPGPTTATFLKDRSGRGQFCTTSTGDRWCELAYTNPGVTTGLFPSIKYLVPAQGCIDIPAAQGVFEQHFTAYECDWEQGTQIDATCGGGEHVGHGGADIKLHDPECDECQPGEWESVSTTTDDPRWGECAEVDLASLNDGCYECRTLTTTIVEFNGCARRTRTTTGPQQREIECPGCVDTPTGAVSANAAGNPLTASATFSDSGTWRLKILAASNEGECNGNDPDYVKRNVAQTLECDGRGTLNTSYSWHGHGSDWWWVTLERNGSLVDRSVCFRNPT